MTEKDERILKQICYDLLLIEVYEKFTKIFMKSWYFVALCLAVFLGLSSVVDLGSKAQLVIVVGFPISVYLMGPKIVATYYVYFADNFPDIRRGISKFWIRKEIVSMKMWVLTVDDVIAGVIALRPINVESVETPHDVTPSTTDAMLTRMVVRREFRGRGLAKTLMTHTINFAREQGYELVHLLTTTVQTEAVAMYRKLGWREVNRSPILWLAKDEYVFEFELDVRDM